VSEAFAMLLPLFRAEVFKLVRRAMPRILLLILVGGVVGLYVLLWLAYRSLPEPTTAQEAQSRADLQQFLELSSVREGGLELVQTLGTILVVILSVSVISTEFSWGTIRTILPRAGSRAGFLTAKYLLLAGFVMLVVVLGFLAAVAGSLIVSLAEDFSRSLGANAVPGILAAIGRTIYVILPYAALAFFIAVLTRSTAAGIAIGLVVLLGEGIVMELIGLLGDSFERLPGFFLSQNVAAVMSANRVNDGSTDSLPNVWRAAAVLLAYTVAFVALAYRIFLMRDVTAGGE
jgi:ABC-type transport system involved in multi-copper enzyme maturation permease subunit